MIEKHHGKYIKSDSQGAMAEAFRGKPDPFTATLRDEDNTKQRQIINKLGGKKWSGRVDLNHRLHGPEPCALPS